MSTPPTTEPATSEPPTTAPATTDLLGVGLLGCAEIARRRVLPALSGRVGARLVTVGSRDPDRAAAVTQQHGGRPVHGYPAVIEDTDVEAVYIPLPAALRAEWIEAALRAGKHVLAEKPITTDPKRTAELFEFARANGLALMENVMFVHHRQHEAVARLIAEGAIGALRSVHATFAVPRRPPGDIRYRADLGGGALYDVGVYPVRAALTFVPTGLEVVGAVLRYDAQHGVDIGGAALLRGPADVTAQVTFGMDDGYLSTYELRGDRGRIVLRHAFTPPAAHQPVAEVTNETGTVSVPLPQDDQVSNTLAAFVAAARAGSPVHQDACLRQAELLDAVRSHARV